MLQIKRLKNKNSLSSESSLSVLKSRDIIWTDIVNPTEKELKEISEITKIKISYFKEYLNQNSKPRTIEIGDYTLIVLNTLISADDKIKIRPLIIVLSKNHANFITVHKTQINSIKKLFALEKEALTQIFFSGPASLFSHLTENIIDEYFLQMELIQDKIDKFEEEIFKNKATKVMEKIHETKKSLIYLHKSLISNREVLATIGNEYSKHFTKEDMREFRILHTDVNQLIDLSSTYREILSSTAEVHLSNISNNLNIIMKKLTAWAAIVLVPTLIAGVYGMNFKNMPELYWQYGYYFALGLMALTLIILITYFKRKDYF